jgi:hypothetical protein
LDESAAERVAVGIYRVAAVVAGIGYGSGSPCILKRRVL